MAWKVDFAIGLSFELIFNSEPKKRKCSLSLQKKANCLSPPPRSYGMRMDDALSPEG